MTMCVWRDRPFEMKRAALQVEYLRSLNPNTDRPSICKHDNGTFCIFQLALAVKK
jgi:hypothetical protein